MDSLPDSNKTTGEVLVQSPGKVVPPWIKPPDQPSKEPESSQTGPESVPSAPQETSPPKMVKKSPFSKLTPLIILLVLGVGFFFLITKVILPLVQKTKEGKSAESIEGEKITLTYWGLWESEEVMKSLITEYQKTNSNVTINYSQQSYQDYRERLQSALARDEGPDIFRFHNTWLAMLKKEIAPAPLEIAQTIKLEEDYYPVVSEDLKVSSQIFGVPLGFDGLALFYNTEILREAGKTYPATWDEFQRTAQDLCVADAPDKNCSPGTRIVTAGAALGTATNVDHFSDILGLMMLQNGVDLAKPSGILAEDALKFYTFFVTVNHVWDETLPSSVYAFATGKVAMIFAPSWRAYEISQINPELDFKTAPVPQLPGTQISWASYWTEGVSSESKNIQAAWEFLIYLSSKETLTKLYAQASQLRDFGVPYARKDLASQLEDDPFVGAFVKQAPYAKSWYLCSQTHDNGINDKIIKYFEDAVNKVLEGESAASALIDTAQGVAQVLSQYGIK